MSGVEQQRSALYAQIRDAQLKLDQLGRIPAADDYAHGTVLKLRVLPRYARDEELVYVFLKVQAEAAHAAHWYFTGSLFGRNRNHHERWVAWDTLVYWLMHDVELVSWDELTPKTVGESMVEKVLG